jgi:cyclase
MTKDVHAVVCAATLLGGALLASAGQRPVARTSAAMAATSPPGLSYRFERVADGVYCAIASGVPYYVSNSVVIVGDDGVLLVDSGAGPNEALALRDGIRAITDRPVRYVVDTHFHLDHAFGHQAFPEALIVSHEDASLRDAVQGRTFTGTVAGLPEQIGKARAEAEKQTDPAKRAELVQRAEALLAYHKELTAFVPDAASATFSDRLTLRLGAREVRVLHLGRGHTAGDVVVFLPQARVVCTGDLFNGYVGYMGDAYVDEWAETLARLAELDFETVVAGHGEPFKGRDAIAPVQAVLRDLWRQAAELKRAGVTADEAAVRVDLRAHAARFPRLAQLGFEPLAVRRIYEVIDQRAAQAPSR